MFGVWRSVFVLAVGLSLGKAAPSSSTPQDCQSMITALSLDNTAKFSGRWNLIEGFSDHNDFKYRLKWTQSSWIDFTPSAEDNRTLTMVAHERMNGACTVDLFNVTFISNITMDVRGDIIESKFNLLSTCDDCLVVNITTAKRCDKSDNPPVYHSLYILARGRSLNQSDLEAFHQQARCMNFSLPPDFHYDHRQAPASTPQDCQSMNTALSLDNTAKFSGRWNLIEGLSDYNDFIYLLNWTQSSWIDFTPSAEDNRTLTMVAHERMNGACTIDLFNVTIISNITMDVRGDIIESKFNLLSTCDDCLVVNITTAKRCDKSDNPPVHHSLYILARGQSLNQSDLEVFHQQARCMNFSLPPDFHYDHRQEFCPEHNVEAAVEKPESNVVLSRWDTKTVCN